MNLSVAVRMDQDAVLYSVCPTQRFIYDVVVMPACHLGDGLAQMGQMPPCSFQRNINLRFPCRDFSIFTPKRSSR